MEIEPRHIFFFVFLAVTLTLICGIGDGVLSGPSGDVGSPTWGLAHGNLTDKLTAIFRMFNVNYNWLPIWLAWPFRIINYVVAFLIARALWKLVPVIGR